MSRSGASNSGADRPASGTGGKDNHGRVDCLHLGHSGLAPVYVLALVANMSRPLLDPNDPLVSSQELITSAQEALAELKNGLFGEEPPAIIDTDPEWLDASFEYLGEVLEALKERQTDIDDQ